MYQGRYVQYGCQGLCGAIIPPEFPACGAVAPADAAVAATDDGHVGAGDPFSAIVDGTWAANNEAARDDCFYRAPHVVSLASKRIITAFYRSPPAHSYFTGCSTGGREGLSLAQRYPHDFDGIVAGVPDNDTAPFLGVYLTWIVRANIDQAGRQIMTPAKLPALHDAVLAACDGLDGLVDGQIDDPSCEFLGDRLSVREFHRADRGRQERRRDEPRPRGFPAGKLILWHGWADQSIPPAGALDCYQRLWQRNGPPRRWPLRTT